MCIARSLQVNSICICIVFQTISYLLKSYTLIFCQAERGFDGEPGKQGEAVSKMR